MNGIALAILIPFAGTVLGAAFVFLLRNESLFSHASRCWASLLE